MVIKKQSDDHLKMGASNINMKPTPTLFDRIISRPRRGWVLLGIALFLFLTPMIAAYADGALTEIFNGSQWRGVLIPATVILYILFVAPRLNQQ